MSARGVTISGRPEPKGPTDEQVNFDPRGWGRWRSDPSQCIHWADGGVRWPPWKGKPCPGIIVYLHHQGIEYADEISHQCDLFAIKHRLPNRSDNVEQSPENRQRGTRLEVAVAVAFDLSHNTRPGFDQGIADCGECTEARSKRDLGGPLQVYRRDLQKKPDMAIVLGYPIDFKRQGFIWFLRGWMTPREAFEHDEWAGKIGRNLQQLVPHKALHRFPVPEVEGRWP